MEYLDFNCLLIWLTPCGKRNQRWIQTTAIAADLALDLAERILRSDKRRKVVRVLYGEARQI